MIKNRSHIIYSLIFLCGTFVNYSFCQKTVSFDEVWSLRTNPNRGQTILIDEQQPNYFYFANKEDGVKIFVHNEPADPVQIKHFTHDSLGGMDAMNIFQLDSFLYVALGDFFSTESKPTGVAIIDISNPQNAFITDIWSTPVSFRGAPYLHTDGQNAWLCVMERGIVFLNVSDKSNIDSTTVYLPDKQWPVPDPTNVQLPNVRYVTLVDSLLYVCFDAGGLRVLDISNDENILEVGRYVNPLLTSLNRHITRCTLTFPMPTSHWITVALKSLIYQIKTVLNKSLK